MPLLGQSDIAPTDTPPQRDSDGLLAAYTFLLQQMARYMEVKRTLSVMRERCVFPTITLPEPSPVPPALGNENYARPRDWSDGCG